MAYEMDNIEQAFVSRFPIQAFANAGANALTLAEVLRSSAGGCTIAMDVVRSRFWNGSGGVFPRFCDLDLG